MSEEKAGLPADSGAPGVLEERESGPSVVETRPRAAFTEEKKRSFRAWGRDLFRPRANPFGRSDATNDPDGRALALWRPAWEGSVVAAAFPLAAFYAWGAEGAWAAPLGFCIGAFGCVRLLDVVLLLRRRAKLSGKAPAFMGWGDLVLRMRHMQERSGKTGKTAVRIFPEICPLFRFHGSPSCPEICDGCVVGDPDCNPAAVCRHTVIPVLFPEIFGLAPVPVPAQIHDPSVQRVVKHSCGVRDKTD